MTLLVLTASRTARADVGNEIVGGDRAKAGPSHWISKGECELEYALFSIKTMKKYECELTSTIQYW